jgi:NADPH:quinone reductase-like Zn-dependent oxidoreductase
VTWVTTAGAKTPVGKVFEFADLPAALEYLDGGGQVGKVVIRHPE